MLLHIRVPLLLHLLDIWFTVPPPHLVRRSLTAPACGLPVEEPEPSALVAFSAMSSFFDQYPGFQHNPQASLFHDFKRLAAYRGWTQGSKSQKYEKAWRTCFGPDVPVRQEPTGIAQEPHQRRRKAAVWRVARDFDTYYGSDASKKEKWQQVCRDCGLAPIPSSIKKCKEIQRHPVGTSQA